MTRAEAKRALYKARREAHKCVNCGADLPEGETRCMCEGCRKWNRKFYKGYRDLLRKLHRCTHCGAPLDDKEYKTCSACREAGREAKRRAKGNH